MIIGVTNENKLHVDSTKRSTDIEMLSAKKLSNSINPSTKEVKTEDSVTEEKKVEVCHLDMKARIKAAILNAGRRRQEMCKPH